MNAVTPETRQALAEISGGESRLLDELLEHREILDMEPGLDDRTLSLVQIAALVALDAPPASYARQVDNALEAGASPEDLLGVLRAVAVHVGRPKLVAAAPEIMLALGVSLPDGGN